jgi:hypothetical protein
MLIVRGIGMGMLFIPITTLSLSTLKGQQIGQGAAFTGMMRTIRRIVWCCPHHNFYVKAKYDTSQ